MEKVTGIARDRLLPTFDRVRFSKWFRDRDRNAAPPAVGPDRGPVALFPTCLVEYQEPAIGKAAVAVFEHNGFTCELPEGQVCCGMPWLDAGDTEKFREAAQRNVDALLARGRGGTVDRRAAADVRVHAEGRVSRRSSAPTRRARSRPQRSTRPSS